MLKLLKKRLERKRAHTEIFESSPKFIQIIFFFFRKLSIHNNYIYTILAIIKVLRHILPIYLVFVKFGYQKEIEANNKKKLKIIFKGKKWKLK